MAHPVIALASNTLLNNGRYRIERELNRGGTAVVYAAEDMQQGGFVALKVMNSPDLVPIKVVKREIAFSASARHANIVRLLDVFAERAQLVIVWELISGPDLLDLLNEHSGRLPEPMAAFFFVQLLQAVMFMHNHGFCHRDIKPENCMLQRNHHQLKLIDFGLSKHLESARTLGVGTPDYLSPEMLQVWAGNGGETKPYDARAVDAWAMGVMMYLLITGRYPFEDPAHPNNLAFTIHNVLAGRMRAYPDTMSPGCQALISGLLRVDPTQRTNLHDLLANPWLQAQARTYAQSVGRLDLLGLTPTPTPAPPSSPPQLPLQQQPPPPSPNSALSLGLNLSPGVNANYPAGPDPAAVNGAADTRNGMAPAPGAIGRGGSGGGGGGMHGHGPLRDAHHPAAKPFPAEGTQHATPTPATHGSSDAAPPSGYSRHGSAGRVGEGGEELDKRSLEGSVGSHNAATGYGGSSGGGHRKLKATLTKVWAGLKKHL